MMFVLYNISIFGYDLLIRLAAIFGVEKAKKIVAGRKIIYHEIDKKISAADRVMWFHCASLGEFEQGRPVIESLKKKQPDVKILVSFFSPSGYDVRKNYEYADCVVYLPADTPFNAKKFVRKTHPEKVFFIKYEFWFNFIKELKNSNVPVYNVSGIFRKDQYFFKWYGTWFRKQLLQLDTFFVQNRESYDLIKKYAPEKVVITGDTRFDRVFQIAQSAKQFDDIKKFKGDKPIFLVGSSWAADEKRFLNKVLEEVKKKNIKLIIAPHEVHRARIDSLMQELPNNAARYSEKRDFSDVDILVIDSIGILYHLYQYADIAYIGGGFGVGLHNTLEAATFGLPMIFGPNYHKFKEAKDLIFIGAAFSIDNSTDFDIIFSKLLNDISFRENAGKIAGDFILQQKGGTEKIINHIM
ncbi:MAG: glycosyltransferase N-terminal domain-containing protein [Bacteroidota bacterium]|nr:glycosyltransferase N-terminal domain-containing protein [Bacteroidota bacterium]